MKTHYTVALAMVAGFGLGAVAVQGLHAQAKAPVYYVAQIDVTDPDVRCDQQERDDVRGDETVSDP